MPSTRSPYESPSKSFDAGCLGGGTASRNASIDLSGRPGAARAITIASENIKTATNISLTNVSRHRFTRSPRHENPGRGHIDRTRPARRGTTSVSCPLLPNLHGFTRDFCIRTESTRSRPRNHIDPQAEARRTLTHARIRITTLDCCCSAQRSRSSGEQGHAPSRLRPRLPFLQRRSSGRPLVDNQFRKRVGYWVPRPFRFERGASTRSDPASIDRYGSLRGRCAISPPCRTLCILDHP